VMNDEAFMRRALDEAAAASEHGEVPIGAVLVKEDVVVAAAGNERQLRQDPTAHAEILVLRAGAEKLGTWRLDDTTLYVTLEPCPMCAGALVLARVKRLVYGSQDPKAGAALSLYNIVQDPRLNHEVEITPGVLGEETAAILQSFFQGKRAGPTL
jgi:tRNA(adenine34) deaminase